MACLARRWSHTTVRPEGSGNMICHRVAPGFGGLVTAMSVTYHRCGVPAAPGVSLPVRADSDIMMLGVGEAMVSDELVRRVRVLRERGCSPKEIARSLGVPAARIAPIVRAVAAERQAAAGEPPVVGCWVSQGWRAGLTVESQRGWPGIGDVAETGESGLVGVLVARRERHGRVSVCGYLVDVYCLGVKDVLGPRVVDEPRLDGFTRSFFSAFDRPPLAAPIELAQHLVLGSVEYARSLGFEPAADFAAARGQLGSWTGPAAIAFGR